MTTFAEMLTKVYAITSRRELETVTKLAIAKATIEAHQVDFFHRDRRLGQLTYTVNSTQALVSVADVYATYPRLRGIESVIGLDSSGRHVEGFEQRDYSDFYDSDGSLRYSVYDIIGTSMRLVPLTQTGLLEVVAYENPVVTEAGYSSWIADEYPDFLACWAAMIVQARSGAMEQAQASSRLHVEPFKDLLRQSHLLVDVH